jgi:hypothetical protein
VVFAVLDPSAGRDVIGPFERLFREARAG